MKENDWQDWQRVVHTFAPIYNEETRVLILGTAPSVKSREHGFYYGHPQNRFWKVLAGVAGADVPETIEEKRQFLLDNGIGVYDVIESCDIKGSSDSSIRNVIPVDLSEILNQTGAIPVVTNGGTAFRLYRKYLEEKTGIPSTQLPSTSPANAAWRLERLIEVWGQVLGAFLQ